MKKYGALKEMVEIAIDQMDWQAAPPQLIEPAQYLLSIGGKRIRPILCLLGTQLFDGKIERALSPALGIELFHNFSLMHDDIMDEAPLRRGMESVHHKYNLNTAILSGDFMFAKSYELITAIPDAHLGAVMKAFNKASAGVCCGQQLDMNFETTFSVTTDDYIRMIGLKTAILVATSLKIGAILADAPEKEVDHLYQFGWNIGLAFQLQDDILDTFGEENLVGKQTGGDIVQNKKTFLLLKALENEQVKAQMMPYLLATEYDPKEKVQAVKSMYESIGIQALAEEKLKEFYDLARQNFEAIKVADAYKKPLVEVVQFLMKRNF